MKKLLWTFFGIPIMTTIFGMDYIAFAQNSPFLTDTIIQGGGMAKSNTLSSTQSVLPSVNITGNIKALVVSVGFSDMNTTYPTLDTNHYYQVLGVDTNGTLLHNFILTYSSSHGDSLPPEDLWYSPELNHYFRFESGGLFNVNFQFVKKANGTRYTPTNSYDYFKNLNGSDYYVIWNQRQQIINEVAQNMYTVNTQVFDNVKHISFTFKGITKDEFYDGRASGVTPGILYTLYNASGQPLWTGPITFQLSAEPIAHEFMHSIGASVGKPNNFYGLPDRGYSPNVYDPNPGYTPNAFHGNMNYSYDIMYHNGWIATLHSLYGILPITSYDKIFLGWIKPDEISTITQSNFTNFSDIKLADINFPLTAQQKSNGYNRIVKVIIKANYDNNNHDEYYLIEYHNATGYDKNFENYDEYLTGGYNTGVLVWHVKEVQNLSLGSDNLIELEPAVPYNSWNGNPIPNDTYPSHNNFNRLPLLQYSQNWWNGIYSGDFSYLDDNRQFTISGVSHVIYFPDGGNHVWETTVGLQPGYIGYTSLMNSGTVNLFRQWSMKSDFFSNSNVKGYVTNSMTDGTRPSTKEWGYYNSSTSQPVSNKTHIAMTNITRQSGYMTVRVYFNAYDGNLTQNTTINGNAYIASNLTVNAGITLTVASGTNITFLNGSSLIVNGTLNAVGNSSNRITFDFIAPNSTNKNGIKFNSSSGGSLSYCNIKNGYYGAYCSGTGSLPPIRNCTISNSTIGIGLNNVGVTTNKISKDTIISYSYYGIELYASSPSYIDSNTISSNGYYGVLCESGSTPYMKYNVVKNNIGNGTSAGIFCTGTSPAHLTTYPTDSAGHNVIKSNGTGISAAYGSNVVMGLTNKRGVNSLYGNTSYEVVAAHNTTVYAQWNWWGSNPHFLTQDGGSIDHSNPLPNPDPNGGMGKTAVMANSDPEEYETPLGPVVDVSDTASFFDPEFEAALDNMGKGRYEDAIGQYLQKFKKEKNTRKKSYALIQLAECYRSAEKKDFVDFLDKEIRPSLSKNDELCALTLELENLFLINQCKFNKAIENYNTLRNNFTSNEGINKQALFNLCHIYYNELKDTSKANACISELKAKYPDDDLTLLGMVLLGGTDIPQRTTTPRGLALGKGDGTSKGEVPDKYSLFENYPNPFNPTTSIGYQVPKEGFVTIRICDVLGREVAMLVNQDKKPGKYNVEFNAANLSSGMYFYQLKVNDFVSTKKMMLLK